MARKSANKSGDSLATRLFNSSQSESDGTTETKKPKPLTQAHGQDNGHAGRHAVTRSAKKPSKRAVSAKNAKDPEAEDAVISSGNTKGLPNVDAAKEDSQESLQEIIPKGSIPSLDKAAKSAPRSKKSKGNTRKETAKKLLNLGNTTKEAAQEPLQENTPKEGIPTLDTAAKRAPRSKRSKRSRGNSPKQDTSIPGLETRNVPKPAEKASKPPQAEDTSSHDDITSKSPTPSSKRSMEEEPNAAGDGSPRKRKKRSSKTEKAPSDTKTKDTTSGTINFHCSNLPPGVTQETLQYFLAEDGIEATVTISRKKNVKHTVAWSKLSAKQKTFKSNVLKAAKDMYATVIVKTGEAAMRMKRLNGITMPSFSHQDWATELKIVRLLPTPSKFPYKIHIAGLPPGTTKDELTSYLESRGLAPGEAVIVENKRRAKRIKYAFVWFATVPECNTAVDMPSPLLKDKPLVITHSFKPKINKKFEKL